MLDTTKILNAEVKKSLRSAYQTLFTRHDPADLALVEAAADVATSKIADCDAPYHNVEHTAYVTVTGLAILQGRHIESPLTNKQWVEAVLAMLFHDIGFVRKLCKKDNGVICYSGLGDEVVRLKRGSTDASMMPYHVNRGKCFVIENYGQYDNLDIELICRCIERTRFPVPDEPEYRIVDDMPGLVRSADLIGQFCDPRYISKLNVLFHEFDEQGLNAKIGYKDLQDMRDGYPDFFNNNVVPLISEGARLLEHTETGQKMLASMQNNLELAQNGALTN